MELFGIFKVGGLFALHREHDDFMDQGEFFEVGFFVAFFFGKFESLRQKILIHGFLNFVGMFLFVVNPAGELIGIFSWLFGEFGNLLHRLGDGALVGVEVGEHRVIRINPTGDLTVCAELRCGGKTKNGGGGDG